MPTFVRGGRPGQPVCVVVHNNTGGGVDRVEGQTTHRTIPPPHVRRFQDDDMVLETPRSTDDASETDTITIVVSLTTAKLQKLVEGQLRSSSGRVAPRQSSAILL